MWVGDGVEEKQRRMIVRSSRSVNGFESLLIFTVCVCVCVFGVAGGEERGCVFHLFIHTETMGQIVLYVTRSLHVIAI